MPITAFRKLDNWASENARFGVRPDDKYLYSKRYKAAFGRTPKAALDNAEFVWTDAKFDILRCPKFQSKSRYPGMTTSVLGAELAIREFG
jgi:hypothetical protein